MNENLDPRAAAEEIGFTFLPSVLIGLSNAPDIVELPAKNESISLHPDQIESIVVPNGALGGEAVLACLLYTSPSPRDISGSRMPSSA